METSRYRISGDVTLARDGYRSRVSDLLNATEREFLALTDVTVEPLDGGESAHYEFMALARRHIVFASSSLPDVDGAAPSTVGPAPLG